MLSETEKAEKNRKKEEGKKRAKEVAIQRRQQAYINTPDGDLTQIRSPREGRHGARNQHRHKDMARWLLRVFPHLETSNRSSEAEPIGIDSDLLNPGDNELHVSSHVAQSVLDVAGGKGELAARLSICHKLSVVMVDPREADVVKCFDQIILPKLPNKWQKRLMMQKEKNPNFTEHLIQERFRQLVMNFSEEDVESSPDLRAAVEGATLLVGMHADGATEAIVNVALKYGKPFVVVPCCVFPNLFTKRELIEVDGSRVPVRTHDQFCRYLAQKDSRFVMEVLPFEGRNIGIWWAGP
jgi:hypothetical protein